MKIKPVFPQGGAFYFNRFFILQILIHIRKITYIIMQYKLSQYQPLVLFIIFLMLSHYWCVQPFKCGLFVNIYGYVMLLNPINDYI